MALRIRLIKTCFSLLSSPMRRGNSCVQEFLSSYSSRSPWTRIRNSMFECYVWGEKISAMFLKMLTKSKGLFSSSSLANFNWRRSSKSLTNDYMNSIELIIRPQYLIPNGTFFRSNGSADIIAVRRCKKKITLRMGVRSSWLIVEVKFSVYYSV